MSTPLWYFAKYLVQLWLHLFSKDFFQMLYHTIFTVHLGFCIKQYKLAEYSLCWHFQLSAVLMFCGCIPFWHASMFKIQCKKFLRYLSLICCFWRSVLRKQSFYVHHHWQESLVVILLYFSHWNINFSCLILNVDHVSSQNRHREHRAWHN